MNIPPRNVKTDKLTSFPLLFYSYALAGFTLTGGCLYTYFRLFQRYGIDGTELYLHMGSNYFPAVDDTKTYDATSHHSKYSPDEQKYILWKIQAAWFMTIVTGQACHIWFVRTSTESIFANGFFPQSFLDWFYSLRGAKPLPTKEPKDEEAGETKDVEGVGAHKDEPITVFSNVKTNTGVCCAIILGCFVIYCPELDNIVQSRPPDSVDILIATILVFVTFLVSTEARKAWSRKNRSHWLNKKYLGW
jgi:magnesium-transporting ATPase (P-type)